MLGRDTAFEITLEIVLDIDSAMDAGVLVLPPLSDINPGGSERISNAIMYRSFPSLKTTGHVPRYLPTL